jgi:hypothetical protein
MQCDALTNLKASEAMITPGDRPSFYLSKLEITASHLADLMAFLASQSRDADIGKWDVFQCADYCVSRLVTTPISQDANEHFRGVCNLLHANVVRLRGWSGPAIAAARYASIVHVAAVVLGRLYGFFPPSGPSAIETAIQRYATCLQFPIGLASSLTEQAQRVIQNLEWLAEQLRGSKNGTTLTCQ